MRLTAGGLSESEIGLRGSADRSRKGGRQLGGAVRFLHFAASVSIDFPHLRERFVAAQLSGDRREALRLVVEDGLRQGASAQELQLAVIQEAQRHIGELWQQNRVSVAQEHLATAISHMALSHVYDSAAPARANGATVLVACVEGELHDLPARIVADALDLAGFHVRYLGANVPTDDLVRMVQQSPPDLVALSVTMAFNLPALRAAVSRLRASVPPGVRIAIGGAACVWNAQSAAELGADATGHDAAEFVAAAQRLLGVEA